VGLLMGITWLWIVSMIVIALYYATYEYLHWCMHLPDNRWFENSRIFKFLNLHHRIHHKMMHKNLNVVLPFADLVWGTLILDLPEESLE
jgi:sterol desaturase/sphingolipid hydroxylase (fatty acid hydroxylase superfamily)